VKGPERFVAVAFAVSVLAAVGLVVVYIVGGHPMAEGALLFLALGGIGIGLLGWAARLLPQVAQQTQERPRRAADRTGGVADELGQGVELLRRRRFLSRLLLAAFGALGIAALFPIRSLGRAPGGTLLRTAWTPGARLVQFDGSPVRADQPLVGGFTTVFPEGHEGSADSQAVLIRIEGDTLRLPAEKAGAAYGNLVCYSKICTHAGCALGLYLAQTQELRCPCHQSTFDAAGGGDPVYGPAARALPMLPIEEDDEGFLRARGDFTQPVGPAFWELDQR
jgi:ubiquinol-cytochrome c reductase iron-sulfur subunit